MDSIKIKGSGWTEIWNDGKLIKRTPFKNLITNLGKAEFSGLVANLGGLTAPSFIALGSSSPTVAVTDVALTTEIVSNGLSRATAAVTRVTTSVTNDTIQYFKAFTVSGTTTVNEIGIFDASPGGNMITHALTGTNSLVSGNVYNVTYQIQFT